MSYDEDEYGGFKMSAYDEEEPTDEPLDLPEETGFAPEDEDSDDPEDRYH